MVLFCIQTIEYIQIDEDKLFYGEPIFPLNPISDAHVIAQRIKRW